MGKILIIKGANFSAVAVDKVEPDTGVLITVVASPTGGGAVSGGGRYEEGAQVQISAVANDGYKFARWDDGDTNTTRTITVGSSAKTYTAIFREQDRSITWDSLPDEEGVSGYVMYSDGLFSGGAADRGRVKRLTLTGNSYSEIEVYAGMDSSLEAVIAFYKGSEVSTENYLKSASVQFIGEGSAKTGRWYSANIPATATFAILGNRAATNESPVVKVYR